jgi:hopanoid-associated phosphorylase
VIRAGLVAALVSEAACFTWPARPPEPLAITPARGARVLVSGMGAARAAAAAQLFIQSGTDLLISWGTAGALEPGLQAGDLVMAETVTEGASRFECDPRWLAALRRHWPFTPADLHSGCLLSVARPLLTPVEKAEARKTTGAVAADMESGAIAAAARQAGIPFLVIRVIIDPAARAIPPLALQIADSYGQPQIWPLLKGLTRQPAALPALIALARDFKRAQAGLRTAAVLLDRTLREPPA